MDKEKVGLLYIPVIHRGYLDFIESLKKEGVKRVFVVSDEVLGSHEELDYINRKDRIRALSEAERARFLETITGISFVPFLKETALQFGDVTVIAPREDINEFIAKMYLGDVEVLYKDVFLRWNRNNVEEEKESSESISLTDFQKSTLSKVIAEGERSADWWRQVGAALVKDEILIAITHNEHLPEEELPNVFGDTRSLYKKGINVTHVTSSHAEVGVIAEAARKGVSTEGAELYLTDFPCPYCARLVAKSGIKKVYYLKGYSVLDGEQFLSDMGVEIYKVQV